MTAHELARPVTEKRQAKCAQCGITEESHHNLYGTYLGRLRFTFEPDTGRRLEGEIHLCRPCTHEVLSTRLLRAAGIGDQALAAETWK